MQSADSVNHPTRSILNDHDFAPHRKSSASVLSTCNAARFDRGLPAGAQKASAENTLSGRTIGDLEKGYMFHRYAPSNGLEKTVSNDAENAGNTSLFFCRPTLFDSVMDFLDRLDRPDGTVIRQQSTRSEG
jgi:hypothetical protein